MNEKSDKDIYNEIKKEAEKIIAPYIDKENIGYIGLLEHEIKKIYREKGIEWPKEEGIIVD